MVIEKEISQGKSQQNKKQIRFYMQIRYVIILILRNNQFENSSIEAS